VSTNNEHKVAVVTGSSKGIGAGIAVSLARAGYDVYVTYLNDEAGANHVAEQVSEAGATPSVIALDVTDPASVEGLFARVASAHGRLDLLVNNAVQELSRPVVEQTFADWRRVGAVKLDGAFLCTKAAIPLFEHSDCAAMIAVSSYEAEQPSPEHPAYGVATAGLNAFVKAMALYLPKFGARCNAVCPGPVRTPLWEGEGYDDDELWARLADANPVGRNATPEDVGAAVVLLATDATRMLNGNFLYVNGGNHLREP
jgi:NAD(P)-dependent dehydrogenase (short-subunit alcohol dehydrogenase family)